MKTEGSEEEDEGSAEDELPQKVQAVSGFRRFELRSSRSRCRPVKRCSLRTVSRFPERLRIFKGDEVEMEEEEVGELLFQKVPGAMDFRRFEERSRWTRFGSAEGRKGKKGKSFEIKKC